MVKIVRQWILAAGLIALVSVGMTFGTESVDAGHKPTQLGKRKPPAKHSTPSPTKARKVTGQTKDLSKRLTAQEMKAARLIECIQPAYDAWERVTVGMLVAKAREILGEPLDDVPGPRVFGPDVRSIGRLVYGRIYFDSSSMPQHFEFSLYTLDGKVYEKEDPFHAPLTKTGKPSVPVLVTPADGAKFEHVPRFLDLRWCPSSGEYPIDYSVEVQFGMETYEEIPGTKAGRMQTEYATQEVLETRIPYAASSFSGSSPGRWRVKAKNRNGESAWTKWRNFRFLN